MSKESESFIWKIGKAGEHGKGYTKTSQSLILVVPWQEGILIYVSSY